MTLADVTRVRVQQSGLSSRFHQLAVKVYTRRGVDAFRSFPITYSPSREEVRILRARITKPDGSLVESFGDTNRSLNEPWSGMYYDAQAKVLSFPGLSPGDVLELQYRVEDTAQRQPALRLLGRSLPTCRASPRSCAGSTSSTCPRAAPSTGTRRRWAPG